jgi:hypothetical protein
MNENENKKMKRPTFHFQAKRSNEKRISPLLSPENAFLCSSDSSKEKKRKAGATMKRSFDEACDGDGGGRAAGAKTTKQGVACRRCSKRGLGDDCCVAASSFWEALGGVSRLPRGLYVTSIGTTKEESPAVLDYFDSLYGCLLGLVKRMPRDWIPHARLRDPRGGCTVTTVQKLCTLCDDIERYLDGVISKRLSNLFPLFLALVPRLVCFLVESHDANGCDDVCKMLQNSVNKLLITLLWSGVFCQDSLPDAVGSLASFYQRLFADVPLWEYIVLTSGVNDWSPPPLTDFTTSFFGVLLVAYKLVPGLMPTVDQLVRLSRSSGMRKHFQYLVKGLMGTSPNLVATLEPCHFRESRRRSTGMAYVYIDTWRFSYTEGEVLRLIELTEPDGVWLSCNVSEAVAGIVPMLIRCSRAGLQWHVYDHRACHEIDVAPLLCDIASVLSSHAGLLRMAFWRINRGLADCPARTVANAEQERNAVRVLTAKNVYVVGQSDYPCSALEFIKGLDPSNMVSSLR